MKGVFVGQKPLNVLSCAVQGRPGRSAYELACDGGYTGTNEEFDALLAGLSGTLTRLNTGITRLNGLMDAMDNRIEDVEGDLEALTQRVVRLEAAVF